MSDFMLSQLQGLLNKVADDLETSNKSTSAHLDSVLGAIDDLAANVFAVQAVLAVMMEKNPVDGAKAKAWIDAQTGGGATPKAHAVIDMLVAKKK